MVHVSSTYISMYQFLWREKSSLIGTQTFVTHYLSTSSHLQKSPKLEDKLQYNPEEVTK